MVDKGKTPILTIWRSDEQQMINVVTEMKNSMLADVNLLVILGNNNTL